MCIKDKDNIRRTDGSTLDATRNVITDAVNRLGTSQSGYGELNTPTRERYWSELSIEEKLERIRVQVKRNRDHCQQRIEALEIELQKLRQEFPVHVHGADGRVLVPLQDRNHMPWGYVGQVKTSGLLFDKLTEEEKYF